MSAYMLCGWRRVGRMPALALWLVVARAGVARPDPPSPVLTTIFPAGGQAGTGVEVGLEGRALEGLAALDANDARITARPLADNRFALELPAALTPGLYDVRAVGARGISSPRALFVGRLAERLESEPNDTPDAASTAELDAVINGRIEKPGDVDCFRFQAAEGTRLVLECWAERIDSPLRAVLEVYDTRGARLAANRGFAGLDPLVSFEVPASGEYVVKVFDLTYAGTAAHVYRLDVDTGPRPLYAHPCVIQRGTTARVPVFGWNLLPRSPGAKSEGASAASPAVTAGAGQAGALGAGGLELPLDRVEVDIRAPAAGQEGPMPLPLRPAQLAADLFAWTWPGGHFPLFVSATDVPVVLEAAENHSPASAQPLAVPCEVAGQLGQGDEQDWFAVEARRGDVLWIEAFAARIGSPVDLDLVVLDASGQRELAHWTDCLADLGGYAFSTSHVDPAGRWVAPGDGRHLIMLRNMTGGLDLDPRRVYRLSVRREEADFHLAAVSLRRDEPRALNVARGGRAMLEVLALRGRGLEGPIRVTARDLPPGVECPDVWLGPGVGRAPLVVTAASEAPPFASALSLWGHADVGGVELVRRVAGGTLVLSDSPTPSGRLAAEVRLAVALDAPALLSATPSRPAVEQGGVLDVAVDIEWRAGASQAPLELTGVCLPQPMESQLASIPSGQTRGWISFYVPASLPPGVYTIALQGSGQMVAANGQAEAVTLFSNPVTIDIQPARFLLMLDPHAPRKIARGQTVQLAYTAQRVNGFIGKIHTELTGPGGVLGLRARGVTFVGPQDSGVLQVIATDNAPLGRQPFLRLQGVGTVEDQPLYRAACPLELEIVE